MNVYDMIMKEIAELPETLNVNKVNIHVCEDPYRMISIKKETLLNTETPVWIAHYYHDGKCFFISAFLEDTFEEGVKQISRQVENIHLFNPQTLLIKARGVEKETSRVIRES